MKRILLILCLFLFANISFSQSSPLSEKINVAKNSGITFLQIQPFTKIGGLERNMESFVTDGSLFVLDPILNQEINLNRPPALELTMINTHGRKWVLELVQQEVLTEDFAVNVSSSNGTSITYSPGIYYQGVVQGSRSSMVALSFFEDGVIGIIDTYEEGNHVFGKLSDGSEKYILYNTQDVRFQPDMDCEADNLEEIPEVVEEIGEFGEAVRNLSNCVRVYIECEHDMYLEKGTVQNTVNHMTGLFNVVATIYDNEQITTLISEIFVWDTPDSYATSSTSNALTSFRSGRSTFNGDVAHLVSRGAPAGGGVAWVNALCSSYNYAYSYIYSTYNEFPTYSWSVEVFTHEMGHNLGSKHTHACVWNGNNTAIDGCGPEAGYSEGCNAPLPPSGTIMSYCHLVSGVGINFNNGFGPQPGDLIRNKINNASCLTSCNSCTLVASINGTDASCNGANTGSATVTPGGGTTPYTYQWSNSQTSQTINNLAAGNYSVTVTDNDNCTVIESIAIGEPTALALTTNISYESSGGNSDGAVDLTVNGGTGPYSYLWSNAAITQDLSGLSPSTYVVTVTDNNGCIATSSAQVETCSFSASTSTTDVDCNEVATGSATVNTTGGTGPYSYLWSNSSTTQTVSNLSAAVYSVTATDTYSCHAAAIATINEPSAIELSSTIVNEQSPGTSDGSITLTISGGTPGYSYLWNNGATTQNITGLVAGTYNVDVTDANGCVKNLSATVSRDNNCAGSVNTFPQSESFENDLGFWINSGDFDWQRRSGSTPTGGTGPSSASEGSFYLFTESDGNSQKSAILESPCFDLSVVISPVLNFVYHMKGGNMGSLIVQASNDGGLTWSTLWTRSGNQGNSWYSANVDLSFFEGDPEVTINVKGTIGTGSKSDIGIDAISLDGTNPPCEAPSIIMSSTPATCSDSNDGSATATASGGNPPYSYSWSNGGTNSSITDLAEGNYSVTVTDNNNCTSTGSVTVSSPSALNLLLDVVNESSAGANDGSIDLTVTGGALPYSFLWENSSSEEDRSGLPAGTYSVDVTDGNNCMVSGSATVIVTPACTVPYYVESFESGIGMWNQRTDDGFDWTQNSGSTPTNNTGPNSTIYGSSYLYTEANGHGGLSASIESSCVDLGLSFSPELLFQYHMYGNNIGTLDVDISDDDGATWATIWSQSGDKGNSWNNAAVSLGAYSGSVVLLRFTGYINGGNPRGDMAIDKVEILDTPPLPPGITDGKETFELLLSPNPVQQTLNITVLNSGQQHGEITIVDQLGKIHYSSELLFDNKRIDFKYRAMDLPNGLYYITATDSREKVTKKFVVIH